MKSQTQKVTEYTDWFCLCDNLEKAGPQGQKSDPGVGGEGLTTKCHEETFRDDRNILHLGCGGDYRTICVCQNPSNYKSKHSEFYSM